MAEDRLILKEKIKLKKEIGLVGNQIDATKKSREDKIVENEQVEKDIKVVEDDNIKLEEQIQGLEEQIAELDAEFKEAQLTAGRLRKMIKMSTEKYSFSRTGVIVPYYIDKMKRITGSQNPVERLE